MLRWLLSLIGLGPKQPSPAPPPSPVAPPKAAPAGASPPAPAARPSAPAEEPAQAWSPPPEAEQFFLELVADRTPGDLQSLPGDDRVFISGILKRIRENQLEIPLLPRAALEISRLLANPNSNLDEFVKVLETDPALSVDVLRISNSAFYAFSGPTQSVQNAVRRIGLNQIRGLVIVAHLHGKVLQSGGFHAEGGWVSDLSMAVANLAQGLAEPLRLDPNAAFTRGVLLHVEHFIIMGTAADVSRDHHRKVTPSRKGLLEAFCRFGPKVRDLAAKAWKLEDLMLDLPEKPALQGRYSQIERGLIGQWTGQNIPWSAEGVSPERLAAACRQLRTPAALGGGPS